jgi:hypothetical protein
MRSVLGALVVLQVLVPLYASAADEKVLIQLNSIESAENRCRLNFVVENKSNAAIDSLQLDFVAFGTDGGILRRFVSEMGPVRAAKTMVRAFSIDVDCRQIGSILINDVTACAPAAPGTCLDGLGLSSRIEALRLYK